jgi:hypothetical protein
MFLLNIITLRKKENNKNWTIFPLNYLIYNLVILAIIIPIRQQVIIELNLFSNYFYLKNSTIEVKELIIKVGLI